jgi:hypothetical protein
MKLLLFVLGDYGDWVGVGKSSRPVFEEAWFKLEVSPMNWIICP